MGKKISPTEDIHFRSLNFYESRGTCPFKICWSLVMSTVTRSILFVFSIISNHCMMITDHETDENVLSVNHRK